jgi:transposase
MNNASSTIATTNQELLEEVKLLREALTLSRQLNEELAAAQQSQKQEIERLKRQLAWFQKEVFGQKSERFIDQVDSPLLPGFEFPEEEEESETPEIAVPCHSRRASRKDSTAVDIPDDLPRITEVIDIADDDKSCPKTGEQLIEIGRDVTEKLAFRPGEYFVKRIERPKYARQGDALGGILQMPASECILEGSKFDASFMAHVVTEKFAFHMPLNRVIEKLQTREIGISSQTMSSLVINLGTKVLPLLKLMEKRTFEQGVIFTDDTGIKLVKGKGKATKAHMWIYLGAKPNAPPYHIYRFSESRSHRFPLEHLKNFNGIIHADAFQAYEKLDEDEDSGISWAACWAHARRYFIEAGNSPFIKSVLRKMRYLFMFERIAWKGSDEKRLWIRQNKEKLIVDELFEMLKEKVRQGNLLPTSALANAMGYMLSREENFRHYLDNPDLRMDNNPAERALRKLVIGRKNWLYVGSHRSGEATAALLSLVQTCRAIGINPQEYLEDIFRRLMSHPARKLDELLPDRWLEIKKAANATEK